MEEQKKIRYSRIYVPRKATIYLFDFSAWKDQKQFEFWIAFLDRLTNKNADVSRDTLNKTLDARDN